MGSQNRITQVNTGQTGKQPDTPRSKTDRQEAGETQETGKKDRHKDRTRQTGTDREKKGQDKYKPGKTEGSGQDR